MPKLKKKGAIEFSLKELMGIILIIMVIFVLLYISGKFGSTFFGSAKTQGSIKNFNELVEEVNTLVESEESVKANTNFPYYISDDYILVGFSSDEVKKDNNGNVMESTCKREVTCLDFVNEEIHKPPECGSKACLCLWRDSACDDFADDGDGGFDNIERCVSFSGVDYIFTYFGEQYSSELSDAHQREIMKKNFRGARFNYGNFYYYDGWQNSFSPLVLYGECGATFTSEVTKPQRLYVEKFIDNKTSIFITLRSDHTEKRYNDLRKKKGEKSITTFWTDIYVASESNNFIDLFQNYKSFVEKNPDVVITRADTSRALYDFFTEFEKPSLVADNIKLDQFKQINANEAKKLALHFYTETITNNFQYVELKEFEKVILYENFIENPEAETLKDEDRLLHAKALLEIAQLQEKYHQGKEEPYLSYMEYYNKYGESKDIGVPIAVLRLAQLERDHKKNNDKAKEYFEILINKYPLTNEAKSAKDELEKLNGK